MVATATPSNTTTKKAAAAHQRDAMQERLRQIAGSPNAPGRAEADRVLADETPAEAAPTPTPEPAATVAEEPAEEEKPVVKRVKPKPAATVPTEKFSVLMTHDEVAALDKLKAHLKRQGVISRKMPDAWLIRLAVATWTPDGQDFAPLVAAMKEQDGRGKR